MEVKAIVPRGYCKGVVRAIKIAKDSINAPKPIYILGMIVHNQYIVNSLNDLGIKTIDKKGKTRLELLDEIDSGTVIITAHGASDETFKKANDKGLHVIDASCLDVIKSHQLIKERLLEGYEILYIGKKGHPEAEGVLALDKEHIHLIESINDIDQLNKDNKYMITNQTTMSLYDVYDICEYAKKVLNNISIEKETCQATQIRQEAIASLDDDIDIVFIVGDPHSNNTKKLASIACNKANKTVYMIESIEDLDISVLKNKKKAAVSSGASTPTYLTNQVIEYLKQFDYNDTTTYTKPMIDKTKILD
jgi:4-hydroxy-3-methylbut-2-enyl diphosphate reductase